MGLVPHTIGFTARPFMETMGQLTAMLAGDQAQRVNDFFALVEAGGATIGEVIVRGVVVSIIPSDDLLALIDGRSVEP